jgi:hypothetical protein
MNESTIDIHYIYFLNFFRDLLYTLKVANTIPSDNKKQQQNLEGIKMKTFEMKLQEKREQEAVFAFNKIQYVITEIAKEEGKSSFLETSEIKKVKLLVSCYDEFWKVIQADKAHQYTIAEVLQFFDYLKEIGKIEEKLEIVEAIPAMLNDFNAILYKKFEEKGEDESIRMSILQNDIYLKNWNEIIEIYSTEELWFES